MKETRKGYWTTPAEDDTGNESAYCMEWLRVEMLSAMLGYLSSNSKTQDLSRMDHVDYILGTTSKPMLTIGHNRVLKSLTAAICTFPETQSAVVAANGLQTGDATDYAT
ncbi:hypothetical protein BDV34DRAFT_220122 [Aspergillus parasiticus]|uniref:Uncharacterized protein n=1 Tax=Aspergillus parasiticus TaxID=5067 RepID=A0A5N6E0H4_ASPPA|nr:hypothetical protein BDV34DRAFT_220122 [Aspergillus parasiticus]